MKILILVSLCVLAGCAARPTLQELETQAMLTGDWSAVEKRERMELRRKQRAGIECPAGQMAYCEVFGFKKECACVSSRALSMLLR